MIPESQDTVVVVGQPSVANTIRFAVSVLSAIKLDNHSRFAAYEVNHVWPDRLLANKLTTFN